MAVAIPVIAAFASAGAAVATAGGVAAALGTVTGVLAIGGAALTAVGAITKNSKLTKIGGFMGLAGGIGTALGLGAQAAGSAAGSAAQEAANAAWSAGGAAEVAGGAGANAFGAEAAGQAARAADAGSALSAAAEAGAQSANKLALAGADTAGAALQSEPALMNTALNLKPTDVAGPSTYDFSSPLQQRALGAGLTGADVQKGATALWDTAGKGLSGVSQFVKNNKELVDIGGQMLGSAYGPEAERNDILKQQQEFQQSIYNRRMANLNAPVSLYRGGA